MGKLEGGSEGAFTVNWQYSTEPTDKYITKTATFGWNLATINFVEDKFSISDKVEFEFYDKDTYGMSAKDAEASFKIYSDSDTTGFEISLQQDKNERYKKPFSFFLTSDDQSSGETLFVKPGDKIYVEYDDYTIPEDPEGKIGGPYLKGDYLVIIDVATITR